MKMPPHSQQRPQFAIADTIATEIAENVPRNATEVGGKETRNKDSEI